MSRPTPLALVSLPWRDGAQPTEPFVTPVRVRVRVNSAGQIRRLSFDFVVSLVMCVKGSYIGGGVGNLPLLS